MVEKTKLYKCTKLSCGLVWGEDTWEENNGKCWSCNSILIPKEEESDVPDKP